MNHIASWINTALDADPPRHKSLVMTICGDSIAPHGERFWLGSMIGLLEPLGVGERLVRTSVFRLVQEGWLDATREGRRSRYRLAPGALPRFARANRRIYSHPGLDWNGRWTFVLAANGSIDTATRTLLRKELEWEGHAMLASGLMAHPAPDGDTLRDILARCNALDKVFVFEASSRPELAARPLAELVPGYWNLDAPASRYRAFIERHADLPRLLSLEEITPEQAFAVRTLLIHAYRRAQLHDPMLPLSLLPENWPGAEAYALARTIYRLCHARAKEHVLLRLRHEDGQAPDADPAYYARFDGLPGTAGQG